MQVSSVRKIINSESIKLAIAEKIDAASFASWIEPLNINIIADKLVLTAQNQFSADFIKSVYSNILESIASEFGLSLSLSVSGVIKPDNSSANDNKSQTFQPEIISLKDEKIGFDDFVVSGQNTFVLSACKKMVSGGANFSPLFIYGPSGCGKSLLAKCMNSECGGRTLMMSGGQFVSEFIRSMRDHTVFAFKDFCRNCDTFIIDDVQQIGGKRATMDEFIQLVMDLKAANKNIIITSDNAPGNLTGFDRRAQSLFASGLTADVAVPDLNVRKIMLTRSGVALDVAEILAHRIVDNGHLISGVVNKIKTYTEIMNERVTIKVAEKLLSDVLEKNKTPLSMVRAMSEKLGVSFDAVCSSSRTRGLVRSRQIMMTALKSSTKLSLSEIGNLIGGRDHATVLYSIKQIEKLKLSDLIVSAEIDQMISVCR